MERHAQQAGLAPFLIPELATPAGLPDPVLTAVPGPTNEMLALTLLRVDGYGLDAVTSVGLLELTEKVSVMEKGNVSLYSSIR